MIVKSFYEFLLESENFGFSIYLDLDHTLIDPKTLLVRPHLKEFIKQVKELGSVCILTYGKTEEKKELIKKLNINLPIYGHDKYKEVKSLPNTILIDDEPISFDYTQDKMKTLDIDETRVIKIKPWHSEKDDKELLDIIPKIKRVLHPKKLSDKQPFKTYSKAVNLANERKQKFLDGLKAASNGNRIIENIKSKNSFKDKVNNRDWKPQEVYDILRGAILVDNKKEIENVVESIKEVFIVKKIENKNKPEFFGYYGSTHVDVLIDEMICEIQVMTKQLWRAKRQNEFSYQKYRDEKDIPKEELEKSREIYRQANGD